MLINQDESCVILVDIQEKLTPHVLNHEALVERCVWLRNLAITRGVPVLFSEQYPSGLGSTVQPLLAGLEVIDKIEKTPFSCMQSSTFLERIQQLNKSHYILAGIETHVCILQTALEMKEAGLTVFVVADAISSRSLIDHKYGIKRMKQAGIVFVTAEMVLFEWVRKAGTPDFKTLSQAFLR
jgi:nicotinamidase-related amidase